MSTGFYSRIALDNIKKNPRLFLPRILAESGLLGCFYILVNLALDKRLSHVLGGSYIPAFMLFGAVVIGLLSFVLILYINSFLMKQRKREYGLYNVLGMEKRHIVRVLFAESLFSSLISAMLGIGFGILFYKLASLLICRLLHAEIIAGFYYLRLSSALIPALIFFALDFFAFTVNSIAIRRLNPTELLNETHTGEKEPKIKWVLLVIGVLTLGAGYYIAVTTQSPLEAIYLFFAAVILVIIGTYCLFVTGTTFVLKCLKKNKKYYYEKRHMPAVAGLLFRMKQNAVGLASIAILATGVLVMLSTTVSLYGGVEDTMDVNYPRQLYLSGFYTENGSVVQIPSEDFYSVVRETADEYGVEIEASETEQFLSVSYLMRDGALLTKAEVGGSWRTEDLTGVMFLTESAYLELHGRKISIEPDSFGLKKNEIAFSRISTPVSGIAGLPESVVINGTAYTVKEHLSSFPVKSNWGTVVNVIGIVVADEEVLNDIYLAQKEGYGADASEYTDRLGISFRDEEAVSAVGPAFSETLWEKICARYPDSRNIVFDTKWESLSKLLGTYGTFLFLGILLGFVCLFSTILIIYYKQISEGYEDRKRFQIMQKIGMEQQEVKKTIGSQLVLQFFLPLITAGVHTAFAFPILLKLLKVLMLTNTGLFVLCSAVTFTVFSLVYTAVYLLTAKTYYKIVH